MKPPSSLSFKRIAWLFILLLLLTNASIEDDSTKLKIVEELKAETNPNLITKRALATTSPDSKSDFNQCRCDLTSNSCDAYCCCDDDCNSDVKIKWQKTDRLCEYEGNDKKSVLDAADWYDRTVTANINDLQFGLRIYTNNMRSLLWSLFTREQNPEKFLNDDFEITTSTKFAEELEKAEDNFSSPLEVTTSTVPELYSLGTDVYVDSSSTQETFKMPLPNSFGLWDEVMNVRFLENINSTTCTRVTTYQNWATALKAEDYTNLSFYLKTGTTASVTAGVQWIVTDSTKAIVVQPSTTTTFSATSSTTTGAGTTATCACTQVLKEIHYTAYTSGGNEITSVEADVVYVTLAAQTCTNTLRFEQIYSFSFKESGQSRLQSGSPGYVKGYSLLAGKLSTTIDNSIDANENGFQLYGVDENGDCLIETSIDPKSKYYSNPVLSFADNIMYGWSVSKNRADLQTFCTGTDQNIALFKHLTDNLKYIGIYGNSNPHFVSDWIQVEYDVDERTTAAFSGRTCTFDAGFKLVFYVTKFGTEDNPQRKISRAVLTPVILQWVHDLPDETTAKDFHAIISISFQEVPQGTRTFVPTPPNRLPKADRNVLYPFFLFED